MKRSILLFLILNFVQIYSQEHPSVFESDKIFYSIQIKSYPIDDFKKGLALYDSIKQKGYLVYYQRSYLPSGIFIRVRVGAFDNIAEAKEFAKNFSRNEGYDYFIDKAKIFIDNYKNKKFIITTPSAIWLKKDNYFEELYQFKNKKINKDSFIYDTKAFISPRGYEVIFYYKKQIIKININNKKLYILKQSDDLVSLHNSNPKWSPDGKYIAYQDYDAWECITNLWIMNSDGTGDTCLVNSINSQNRVKYFNWHPYKNQIFYVWGFAYGTVNVGGDIYLTDLLGNKSKVIYTDRSNRQEVYSKFCIIGDTLIYKIATFNEDWTRNKYSTHTYIIE